MSVSWESLFPFDGKCDLSRGADITITFSEGAPLKAHSQHLTQASAVLKTALEECKHDGTLNVGGDSREAWILLLNLVHPGRRFGFLELEECSDLSRMVGFMLSSLSHSTRPVSLLGTLRQCGP